MDYLSDIRVIEFSHMVMGPTTGMILGDLGAEVIKIEPIGGDKTRALQGSGAGYFAMFNRNKRSVALNLKSDEGPELAHRLIGSADVVIENFRKGALDALGLGPEAVRARHPAVIYHSCKGFLSGPYEGRAALDEVAQMMGGLAYMTGPSGRPLRAGSSVVDITGAMFGVIGILAALHGRGRTGRGGHITSALYETTAFLVGQHIAQKAVTGSPVRPMPERVSAWAVYDVFDTADNQIFVGVVSNGQWRSFCRAFGFDDWAEDDALATNSGRVAAREVILPRLRETFSTKASDDLMARLEKAGLPHAPIRRPEDLSDDPHLAERGMQSLRLPDGGKAVDLPNLPIEIDGARAHLHHDIPAPGGDTDEVLAELGLSAKDLVRLKERGVAG